MNSISLNSSVLKDKISTNLVDVSFNEIQSRGRNKNLVLHRRISRNRNHGQFFHNQNSHICINSNHRRNSSRFPKNIQAKYHPAQSN